MSTGKDNKTMPLTPEYADGYERVFGKREPVRGRWIQHPVTGELIPESQYVRPRIDEAVNHVVIDRHYWNTASHLDGRDISTRKRHREYMKEKGLTTMDDFTNTWAQAEKERQKVREGDFDHRERRELIGKLEYEVSKNARRR